MNKKYNVIIIGGGISGLVAGCYLAKAGIKTLIVEKNNVPGGYCSFIRKGKYKFNLTTCTIGSMRESGVLNKIFYKELGLKGKLSINRNDPSNTVVTEYGIFDFSTSGKELKSSLVKLFPKESKGINSFFDLILVKNTLESYVKYKALSFGELLALYFSDTTLRNFLCLPCGIFGTNPNKISAFSAIVYYKETIFDGGYYVSGGADELSNVLLVEFLKNKGAVQFSKRVTKINIRNSNIIDGVVLDDGSNICADRVVICSDIKEGLLKMVGNEPPCDKLASIINGMVESSSVFIVYLGLKSAVPMAGLKYKSRNIWLCKDCDASKVFDAIENEKACDSVSYLLCHISSSRENYSAMDQITLYVPVPFMKSNYWENAKEKFSKRLVEKAESLIPGISGNIEFKHVVTPADLHDRTLNYNGALKGWASIVGQNESKKIPIDEFFNNLYVAGQWSTMESGQGGIAMAAFSGRSVAKSIIRSFQTNMQESLL